MKYYLLLGILITCVHSFAQPVDTNQLKNLYDRCLDFSEDKIDSIHYYADYISKEADLLKYNRGNVLSLRLKGIYEDLSNNYEKAIEYYLQSLQAARLINAPEYELAALSDLAIAYFSIREPEKAKAFYLQCARMSQGDGNVSSLINTYNNLAVIYTQLKQYDSSRILLEKAVQLGKPLERRGLISLSSTYNNLGNLYFKEKKFDDALPYFHQNLVRHNNDKDLSQLWVAKLNLADVFIEKHRFDSATIYAEGAMEIAQRLESKSKEADSYSILAKLAEYRGNYKKAYQYIKNWYSLDTAILHSDTYKTIAALQERFHAKEREAENILLQDKIEKETIRIRELTMIAGALGIIGVLIAIGFVIKRNAHRRLKATNDLIIEQNDRLSELNYEKNSLISIVSHDLNTPFATIQIWGQVMQNDFDRLTEEQQKAMNRILQAGAYGERLIRQILDVERADIGNHKMELEKFDLRSLTEELVENFKPMAQRKRIVLHTEIGKKVYILSDRYLVSRICENLLSNAIKYTPQDRNVWLHLNEDQDTISIKVRDEGVGIEKEELPYLFSKYSKISSRTTDGEGSNGLGLSIVKRIVEEINGRITCESEVGKGSVFTVTLKK